MAMSESSLRSSSLPSAVGANVVAAGVDHAAATVLGARLLLAGALGLIVTCLGYVLAGPLAALPGGAPNMAAALAATPAAAGWMFVAGLAGMPSDVLLAVAGLLLAAHEYRRGAALATAGWLALGVASALFIVVDAMVALVLPAAVQAGLPGYAGLRLLFDAMFTIGAWTAGLGALAAAWQRVGLLWRLAWAGWLMRAAGVLGLVASTGHLAGLPGIAALIGPGIAVLAVALVGTALVFAESP
jgi:hypothetical protein